jgi:hypothetical protein
VKFGNAAEGSRNARRAVYAGGLAIALVAAMSVGPAAAALPKSREENRVVNYHAVDRAEIENLQRWVAAGHEDWCKDPRLVAAEELKRMAADFADDATEMNVVNLSEDSYGSAGAKKVAFEWTPLDGRATYRVTVERLEWLLPIAKDVNAAVWVPTMTEIQAHE